MRKRNQAGLFSPLLIIFFLTLITIILVGNCSPTTVRAGGIAAPLLKWQRGGCYNSWCETGWYSSTAVADLDNDGKPEVIASPYSLFVLNGEDGSIQWSVDPPGGRTWPGVVVADIDGSGDLEIALAQGSGYLTVYDHLGNQVWSRRPETTELRGLSAYDLDNDGTLELAVTVTGDELNAYVYEHDGTLRPGWPQLSNDSGYGWGVYNDNAALGDLDGDGLGELVIPSDVHYINAYEANGSQIPANAIYGGDGWGKVGIWESLDIELRGWGMCNGNRAESYRTNFADGPAVIADVNGDGVVELVVTGNVYDCNAGYPPSRYVGVYIFNADRSRFNVGGYNWETVPVDTGAPLSEDYNVIESAMPNPVVADLDGDGEREILFASYDGRLHAYWLDKTERHNWPYNVNNTGPGIRFASEPVVADLDNDGFAEVIFASWPQKGSGYVGKLHILSYQGNVLYEIDLPAPFGSPDWNGAMAAPTLANIDADADLELVLNTAHSGIVAYDLPGTADARILWGTGRGNYQRSGSILQGDLQASGMQASNSAPAAGETIAYTILLQNPGPALATVTMTDTLPSGVTFAGNLTASSGTAGESGGVITWQGDVPAANPVMIQFEVLVSPAISVPQAIVNTAVIDDGLGNIIQRQAMIIVNGFTVNLPLVVREQ
ncbi:hypothetical protein MNBD_CHLOROFLEXI01-910 [hydrothermal vent metagenome]|uniref:DUF11 domain-containing protein n=1 Tax=hydrothermal vent metagenome TaxID=652676 RepID=A0A3B0VJN4_9ZZZZ